MKIKKFFLSSLLLIVFLLTISGCSNNGACTPVSLEKANWSEKNYRVLMRLIDDYGIGGKFREENKPPYIVLDWDQTCAYLDVEEATMRYQLLHLKFKLTREQFKGLLRDNVNGITQLSAEYKNIPLADINADLENDYNYLFDHYLGANGTLSFAEVQNKPQYWDFVTKVAFLYDGYCSTAGIGADYGYPWVIYLFTGHTKDEIKKMAAEAISYELGNPLSKQTWRSPDTLPSKAGVVSYSFKTGLRIIPEMQNLMAAFTDSGFDVYIVTASYKPIVEVFSGINRFGYNIPAENVIGMEIASAADGRLLPEYKAGWVKTYRGGKVEAINMAIKTGLGKNWDPVFSSGDSDGDYEMFTAFPNTKLTLIWNRVKGGDIGILCRQAVNESVDENPRYILQGRDENKGIAIPSPATILFGKTEPQLLY